MEVQKGAVLQSKATGEAVHVTFVYGTTPETAKQKGCFLCVEKPYIQKLEDYDVLEKNPLPPVSASARVVAQRKESAGRDSSEWGEALVEDQGEYFLHSGVGYCHWEAALNMSPIQLAGVRTCRTTLEEGLHRCQRQ